MHRSVSTKRNKKWIEHCILLFSVKGDPEIIKNYKRKVLRTTEVKVYKALCFNHTRPDVEKIEKKKQDSVWRIRPTIYQILTIRRIIEGTRARKLEATLLSIDFAKALFNTIDRLIGLVGKEFVNCLRDLGSIPDRVIPKTLKMVLHTSLFNTQQHVHIKGKVEQSRERSSTIPYTSL